jgi:hypothetical protein
MKHMRKIARAVLLIVFLVSTLQEFIDFSLAHNRIDTGIVPVITDRILTLSTCTGRNYLSRNVVQARLPMMEVTE